MKKNAKSKPAPVQKAAGASRLKKPPAMKAVRLPSSLEMRAARDLKRLLDQRVDEQTRLIVDGAAVNQVSTGCLQILSAFFLERKRNSAPTALRAPSSALSKAIAQLGLDQTTIWRSVEM